MGTTFQKDSTADEWIAKVERGGINMKPPPKIDAALVKDFPKASKTAPSRGAESPFDELYDHLIHYFHSSVALENIKFIVNIHNINTEIKSSKRAEALAKLFESWVNPATATKFKKEDGSPRSPVNIHGANFKLLKAAYDDNKFTRTETKGDKGAWAAAESNVLKNFRDVYGRFKDLPDVKKYAAKSSYYNELLDSFDDNYNYDDSRARDYQLGHLGGYKDYDNIGHVSYKLNGVNGYYSNSQMRNTQFSVIGVIFALLLTFMCCVIGLICGCIGGAFVGHKARFIEPQKEYTPVDVQVH